MSDVLWSAIINGAFMFIIFISNKVDNDKRDKRVIEREAFIIYTS